jgi:hypothetical protein
LAKGYSLLGAMQPRAAITQAALAENLLAKQAAPSILRARAYAQLGQYAAAWEHFGIAEKLEGLRLENVEALHDYARSALATGNLEAARRGYRLLATRASLFSDARQALEAYLEAASLVMQEGPQRLPEVVAYLEEAQRRNDSTLYPNVLGALWVLVRERNGEPERAKSFLAELDDAGLERELAAKKRGPLFTANDRELLMAISQEASSGAARERWQRVLETNEAERSPWVSDIRARIAKKKHLGRGGQ